MQFYIYSVRDRAIDTYGRPVFFAAVGAAVRAFQDEVNRANPDNTMHTHPEDYDLYEIGTFDDQTGIITPHQQPRQVAIGKQMTKSSGINMTLTGA